MSNKSTHSGETLSGEPDVNLSPEAFEEQMEEDRKEDPYLVRFDVDDPANPKVIQNSTHSKIIALTQSAIAELVQNKAMVSYPHWRITGPQCVSPFPRRIFPNLRRHSGHLRVQPPRESFHS